MVTQKLGASKVDQSPDHSSFAPYCWRSRRCSANVKALFHTTPSSTTPGRLELNCGTHRSAPSVLTTGRSASAIWRNWAALETSGSRTAVDVYDGVEGGGAAGTVL